MVTVMRARAARDSRPGTICANYREQSVKAGTRIAFSRTLLLDRAAVDCVSSQYPSPKFGPVHATDCTGYTRRGRGLSGAMLGTLGVLGCALWLFGWRWHRFWVVAGITLAAGLIGLNAARPAGVQVIAVGILLAVAAGMMALELAKVVAFVAGGIGDGSPSSGCCPRRRNCGPYSLGRIAWAAALSRLDHVVDELDGNAAGRPCRAMLLEPALKFDAVAWAAGNQAALTAPPSASSSWEFLLQVVASPDETAEEAKPQVSLKRRSKPCIFPKEEPVENAGPWWKKLLPRKGGVTIHRNGDAANALAIPIGSRLTWITSPRRTCRSSSACRSRRAQDRVRLFFPLGHVHRLGNFCGSMQKASCCL